MTYPWPQILRDPCRDPRRGFRRAHLVGGAADFNALTSPGSPTYDSDFAAAWGDVQRQMVAEGARPQDISGATGPMADAFTQISQGMGIDSQTAASSAKELILTGKTALGAVKTVYGLVQQGQGVTDAQSAAAFSGSLIGVGVSIGIATGALTAGIGALITAVFAVAADVIAAAMPGNPAPRGVEVCPGFFCDGAEFTVGTKGLPGCMCVFAAQTGISAVVSPNTVNWRSFPNPNNPADKVWFQPGAQVGVWGPGGAAAATFGSPSPSPQQGFGQGQGAFGGSPIVAPRPIDYAFPQYANVECDYSSPFNASGAIPAVLLEFMRGWFAAWKANAEYSLNGLGTQSDAAALIHYLRLWNSAHESSSTFAFGEWPSPILGNGAQCPPEPFHSYLETLAHDVLSSDSADLFIDRANRRILINTGARKTPPDTGASSGGPPKVIPIHLGPLGPSYNYWNLEEWSSYYLGPPKTVLQLPTAGVLVSKGAFTKL